MLVKPSGMSTLVRFEQSAKAYSPMLFTPSSTTIVFILVRYECHGLSSYHQKSSISPVPEIVSTPSSSVHVRFSPQVPFACTGKFSVVSSHMSSCDVPRSPSTSVCVTLSSTASPSAEKYSRAFNATEPIMLFTAEVSAAPSAANANVLSAAAQHTARMTATITETVFLLFITLPP